MRIPSGVTDQVIHFVAVDATDFTTRETGLATWTVYRSRNGGAATAMTTPTITELDATNMPGVYTLLLDEDMTIGAGNDSEEMAFHITHAGMAPVTRTIEIYRPTLSVLEAAHSEPTGAPAANESVLDKLGYLFAALRNKVAVTSTTKSFFDDADASLWTKALSDDGTTYTEAEGA